MARRTSLSLFWVALISASLWCINTLYIQRASVQKAVGGKRYEFTEHWGSGNVPQWRQVAEEFGGKAALFLEIGVFEGRQTVWNLENILTHSESRVIIIDTFEGSAEFAPLNVTLDFEKRFRHNIEESGQADQVRIIKGKSFEELIKLYEEFPMKSFDFIYIDGCHDADAVLGDAVLSWPLLKDNGILIFDDSNLRRYQEKYNDPYTAINAFKEIHGFDLEILVSNNQLSVRKVSKERKYTWL